MRRVLPQRRAAETFDLRFWNQPFTVTVGFYADGTPGEVFIDGGKTGQGHRVDRPRRRRGASLALQHGVPIEAIRHAVTRSGSGEAASILGAIVDRLATNFRQRLRRIGHDQGTTYAKAALEYDEEHERALLEAITRAIFEASRVSDCNAVVIRTGEAAQALLTALACVLAMSPSATRSPAAIRKTIDELGKRLRRRFAPPSRDADLQDFVRRSFWNTDEGGNA